MQELALPTSQVQVMLESRLRSGIGVQPVSERSRLARRPGRSPQAVRQTVN